MGVSKRSVSLDRLKLECSTNGYANVTFEMPTASLEDAARKYTEGFLTLPQKEKRRYFTFIDPVKKKMKCGYRMRDKKQGDADAKEIFHYNDYIAEFVSRMSSVPEEVKAFIESAEPIFGEVKNTVRSVLETFEPEVPGITESFMPEGERPYFHLRFIAYVAGGSGNTIATPHLDKGPFTLAIYESHPGLRIAKYVNGQMQGNLDPVTHNPGEAFLFVGDHITEVLPPEMHPYFPKGLHDVIQKDEGMEHHARTSIVAFIDPFDIAYKKSWEERHPLNGRGGRYE